MRVDRKGHLSHRNPLRSLTGGAFALFAAATCGDSGIILEASPGAGGAPAATTSTGSRTQSTTTSPGTGAADAGAGGFGGHGGSGPCGPIDRPASVPEGWLPWTEWACKCPYWIPPDEQHMPDPIAWEPCGIAELPGCRKMTTPWAKNNFPIGWTSFGKLADGRVVLSVGRAISDDRTEYVVGEADGPLRFAMIRAAPWDLGCRLDNAGPSIANGRFGYTVYGDGTIDDPLESLVDGLVWGEIGTLAPHVAPVRNDTDEVWDWSAGEGWWELEGPNFHRGVLYSPDFAEELDLDQKAANSGVSIDLTSGLQQVGRDVLFVVAITSEHGLWAYDDLRGVHPLFTYGNDMSRGAANIGTDGKDIVWTYGEGRLPSEFSYPTMSIMTAPYTTDPAALQPRRLRSDSTGWGTATFAVGCGYAGHRGLDVDAWITRLKDGVAWRLAGKPEANWGWVQVLGFTCDEVFLRLHGPVETIARIKLDSLGPGLPAN